jgi:membrane protein insertase Oxa1/YidC/SpoIIIJ
MLTKILFTILIIMAAIIFLRMKNAEEARTPPGKARPKAESENQKMFRQGAYLFLIFMALSAGVMMYFELGERYKTVKVNVVNTQTGARVSYQAEQQDIKSDSFKTLEGKTVYVADIERIEIEEE